MPTSINEKLLNFISDEQFVEFESIVKRPSFFKIVGRTYTETWHSMLLGWLLDPKGNHGLEEFPLKRLLNSCAKSRNSEHFDIPSIVKFAIIGNLENAIVYPNEVTQAEYKDGNIRLDVFIEFEKNDFDGKKVILIIEQKVQSKLSSEQCDKYYKWSREKFQESLVIPILIAPREELDSFFNRNDQNQNWLGIDYQELHDNLLVPSIKNPNLNKASEILLLEYINTLRIPMKNIKLVLTDEEKELATSIFEKHKDAILALQAALSDAIDPKVYSKDEAEELTIKLNGTEIYGNSVRDYYTKILQFIVDNKIIKDNIIPYETGKKRYLISKSPYHQENNEFRLPLEYKGYYMETHKSRKGAATDILRFLNKLDLEIEY